jgi:hypothetical protein
MSPPLSSNFRFGIDLATNGILDMEVRERLVIGPRLLKRTANYNKSLLGLISLALLQYIQYRTKQPCRVNALADTGHKL